MLSWLSQVELGLGFCTRAASFWRISSLHSYLFLHCTVWNRRLRTTVGRYGKVVDWVETIEANDGADPSYYAIQMSSAITVCVNMANVHL